MVEIAIVGGGPGGLMTAWHLGRKVGATTAVTLYEAAPHLGGKLVTRRFPNSGLIYEAGVAELYDYTDLGHDPLRELIVQTLGLATVPMDSEALAMGDRIIKDFQQIERILGKTSAKSIEKFRKTCQSLISQHQYYEGVGSDDNDHPWLYLSQEDVLFNFIDDETARDYIKIAAHSDVAIAPAHTSGLNALKNHVMDIDGYLNLYSIVGGNQQLVDGLAKLVQADIMTGTIVRRIERAENGRYRLTLRQSGRESRRDFDAVAVCLPLNWLMTLEWGGEALTRAMSSHINHFNYPAHYLRVSIAFETRFWKDAIGGQSWFMSDAFNGCCVYDESARHDHGSKGVLGWLIAGHDALAYSALPDKQLVDLVLDSLPASLREAQTPVLEWDVQRWPYSVNGIPGGRPVRPVRANHLPEPKEHPGLVLVGDYLFDATLNGVLDSADCASDLLVSLIIEKDYEEFLIKQGRPIRRSARGRILPEVIGSDFYLDYRKSGPYAQAWEKFFDPAYIRDLIDIVWTPKKTPRILIVGSASGQEVGALRGLGLDAVGIENNAWIHKKTSKSIAKYNIKADLTDLPFGDDSFDFVYESCLCYLPERKIGKAIGEIHRVAKRGFIFGSITSDLDLDIMDRYELQRGIRTLATWWEWSERFFNAGFDLAVQEEDVLDRIWQRTLAAGRGPGQWYEDQESLRYSLYNAVADEG